MNVKRKTVRFQDNLSDLSVYEAITNYKKYGYRSESHMVIEAVRRLIKEDSTNFDPEKMADLIAERLSGKLSVSSIQTSIPPKEDTKTEEAAFDAALNFLDSF
jgi:hypothetical protein